MVSADTKVLRTADLDSRLVRFIAIAVLTVVCLLHYFSSRAGLFLNKVLFWYKCLMLLVIFAAGIHYKNTHGSQWDNYNDLTDMGTSLDSLAAMISIFYAYQGWENANYVRSLSIALLSCSKEIGYRGDTSSRRTYTCEDLKDRRIHRCLPRLDSIHSCNLSICKFPSWSPLRVESAQHAHLNQYMVLDYETITDKHSDLGLVLHFAPKVSI